MTWAAITIIAMMCADMGVLAVKHGEPKDGNYNFWLGLIERIVLAIILYYAGAFDCLFKD